MNLLLAKLHKNLTFSLGDKTPAIKQLSIVSNSPTKKSRTKIPTDIKQIVLNGITKRD